ncbi:hypothetical protein EJ05DRAFT_481878 [Pseudovirgaria hyperparasitica]|uniref:Uncharacterized protein n=1 Tax=Pseudovirgaria hyperparasitica TaxID=470096 RepID=A0A6A6WLF3_9PEZI|nr:uncharacterized protein EJ05DRAFT_481878 [Pseudovirgaria hyperparasitica]KAF2763027.1 hypothetical protein EJ05DRAFT_481878 [Pseudovirgaria hyperparasitica]
MFLPALESEVPIIYNLMLELQPPIPRKRPRSEPPEPNETSQPVSKKQRPNCPCPSLPPPAFWDDLSKIWLTKRALRELDRRNIQAAPSLPRSPQRRDRRPVASKFVAGQNRNCPATHYAAHYIRLCKPETLKDIKLFARNGGPDLSDVRNYPEAIPSSTPTMSPSRSRSRGRQRGSATAPSTKATTDTTRTKSTGVYDRNFQQNLIDYSIYPSEYIHPAGHAAPNPRNWRTINQRLVQRRPSLSPSKFGDEDYKGFMQADANASKEKQVSESVIPIIEGKVRDAKCRSGGIPFTNLDPLTNGTLKPGNPDLYYGARPEQLSRAVRDEIGGRIIPSTQHDLPLVPNFFLAVKGPDGSAAVLKRQACYDGALGARGIHSLQSYRSAEPTYNNNAYTITSTYHAGTLKMYTSHVAQPRSPGGRPEYNMHLLKAWAMDGAPETFRQGATAYRNARDWAEEQRDEAIRQANETSVEAEAPTSNAGASPVPSFVTAVSETEASPMLPPGPEGSNTSVDEDLEDHAHPAKHPIDRSKTPQARRKRRPAGESDGT